LVSLAEILGLSLSPESQSDADNGLTNTEIEQLVAQRTQARKDKNWAEGDRLRDVLQEAGITLVDKPGGITEWFR
jgi:cysteinyl-tRNA synthetase